MKAAVLQGKKAISATQKGHFCNVKRTLLQNSMHVADFQNLAEAHQRRPDKPRQPGLQPARAARLSHPSAVTEKGITPYY